MDDVLTLQERDELPLQDFLKLPSTVDFNAWMTPAFERYIADKPYIRVGSIFGNSNAVLYTSKEYMDDIFADLGYDYFNVYPQVYGLLGQEALNSSGITWAHDQPYLDLKGRGVLIGFIDTGIDYTQPAFQYEDGTSKIQYIWDQTLDGTPPEQIPFGAVFAQEDINRALRSDDPYGVVPSRDTDGHGTFLASVAGGRGTGAAAGAAPEAEIIAIKLRRASQYYLDKYLVPKDQQNAYESTDIMLGIKFIYETAMGLGCPVVICIGLGTNFGGHNGNNKFENLISFLSRSSGIAFCTAAGNEGNARHHTQGVLGGNNSTDEIGVQVSSSSASFSVNISYPGYDTISVSLRSPTGETTGRIPFDTGTIYQKKLLLENTKVAILYHQDVDKFAVIQVQDATPGIWTITLHGSVIVSGDYNAWLPLTGLVSPNVVFANPFPDRTIVIPATDYGSITSAAYNPRNGSLYINNSWGPTVGARLSPDFVAPGVDTTGIYPTGEGEMSGTSVSTALTTGACALVYQWGIVQKNEVAMNGYRLKTLLIRGCSRESSIAFPNNQWGYGRLNLQETFKLMREE